MLSVLLRQGLQVLILSAGIYLFLRFLRTTRGGGLLRGLTVAMLVGVVGLSVVAEWLELEELKHILDRLIPFAAVILVILFQPELRRGIAQLGQQGRFGRLLRERGRDAISEVSQAAIAMAGRRHGALIAFQREIPLDAYTQNAVRLDSEVNRLLIESIFHPGGTLHDGAIVIAGDRIAAAACLFPLTENIEISKSVGTRHRAALGVTEETDAVTVVVSEETGGISICQLGRMERDVPQGELERQLRRRMGASRPAEGEPGQRPGRLVRLWHAVRDAMTRDLPRKAMAVALASGILFLSHRSLVVQEDFALTVVAGTEARSTENLAGLLQIRLPNEEYHLVEPPEGSRIEITVSGTRGQIDRLRLALGGVLTVDEEQASRGSFPLPLSEVRWTAGNWTVGTGLSATWASERPPRIVIQRYGRMEIALEPSHVDVDVRELDPRFEVLKGRMRFQPTTVQITGPEPELARVRSGELPFRLQTIRLRAEDTLERTEDLGLHDSLRSRGIELVGSPFVQVTLPIVPAERELDTIEKEIPVVSLATGRADPRRWAVSVGQERATFRIKSAGIFPQNAETGSPAYNELYAAIRKFVQDELVVFADVSTLEGDLHTAPVRWFWPPRDWRRKLSERIGQELRESARLEVELVSEPEVLLREVAVSVPEGSDGAGGDETGGDD